MTDAGTRLRPGFGESNRRMHAHSPNWSEQVDRAEKQELVAALNGVFTDTSVVVVAHYAGLNVSQMSDYRSRMRDAGGSVKVAKNRLAKIALEGTDVAHLAPLFAGPTLIAYSDDPVTAPKITVDFAKSHEKLVVIGGALGATSLDAERVKSLASMPSLDELRARIVGMINTPATRLAGLMQAPGGQLARVLNAYAQQNEAA